MSTHTLRRAVLATVCAGVGIATVGATAGTASAQVYPRWSIYQMTAQESWNVCGGSGATIRYDDATIVNCATGQVYLGHF